MSKKRQILKTGLTILISVFLVSAFVHATTTIGDNVSVGGTLEVTGASTLSGATATGLTLSGTNTTSGILSTGTQAIGIHLTGTYATSGIQIGTSVSSPLSLAEADDYAIAVFTTSPATSGTVKPIYMKSVMAGAGAAGGRAEFHTTSNVASGSFVNALKGYMEFGSSGTVVGLASAINAEMLVPNNTVAAGQYYVLEINMVGGASTDIGNDVGKGWGYIYTNVTTAGANFGTYGNFLRLDGLTADTDKLLSLTSQTLRTSIGGSTTRYLVLSQLQDGLGLGTSGSPMDLPVYTDRAVAIFTTSDVASNSDTPITAFQLKSTTTGTQSEDWTMSVHSLTDVYSGNENTVGHFYSEWGTTPGIGPLGMASAVTAKMLLPTSMTGAFFPFYGKINLPASPGIVDPSTPGNSTGWFLLSIGGDTGGYTNFDNNGLFMEIHNISAGAGNLLSESSRTLKVAVPAAGSIKYLMLSTAENSLTFAGDTTGTTAIKVGTATAGTGVLVDQTDSNYAVEFYADLPTGTVNLSTNTGTLNSRLTIADGASLVSGSFQTASYNRLEINAVSLGTTLQGWNTSILGYTKNPSGTVNASAAQVAAIVGLINLGSGYTDPAGWTAAFIAGTYGNSGAITDFTAYLVMDQAQDNFDNGFFCANDSATTCLKVGTIATGINLSGTITTGISSTSQNLTKFISVGTYDTPIVWTGADEFVEIHARINHATNAKPVVRIRNSPEMAQVTGRIVALESTANGNSTYNMYDVWGINAAAQMKGVEHILDGGSFVGAKMGVTDLGNAGVIDSGAIAAGAWVTTGMGATTNSGLHGLLIMSHQGSLPVDGMIIVPDASWQAAGGAKAAVNAFIYTMDNISDFGSVSTNWISSGTLTASGTINSTDVKCDARMRIDIAGTSYWIPLYDTAP